MKIGVRWQIKGVGEEARDAAREAARRAGMSVGEWLDSAIIDSASEEGIVEPPRRMRVDEFEQPYHEDDDDVRPRRPSYRDEPRDRDDQPRYRAEPRYRDEEPEERPRKRRKYADYDERHRPGAAEVELDEVNDRIDFLTRQLDELADQKEEARSGGYEDDKRYEAESSNIADAISRLDHRLDQLIAEGRAATSEIFERMNAVEETHAERGPARAGLPSGPATPLDQALLEIADRQRMLDGDVATPLGQRARAEPARTEPRVELPRAPTQGFADLESQLRSINKHMETLGSASIDKGVETLRNDLAEIGMMLKDAMPRQSIDALENQIRTLGDRLDQTRHAGGGGGGASMSGLESGLTEVRDALRALTPRENLVGLDEAVRGLAGKVDRIASQTQDPHALQQLEGAIVALRGIVSHVASNDALTKLSDEVRDLATKVDHIARSAGSGDVLYTLEQRIASIADALQSRGQTGQEARDLESIVAGLTDKLERLQLTRTDQTAVGHLEDRIVKLVEKLDASDSRLSHLETIERGLAELLIHIEHQRLPSVTNGGASRPEVDMLKRDVQQTQDSLEVVHGTLGHVVDRLAQIETGIRGPAKPQAVPKASPQATPQAAPQPAAAPALRQVPALPPVPQSRPAPAAVEMPAAPAQPAAAMPKPAQATQHERRPIDSNLPPDHPLEPGAMRGRGGSTPSERIAASEAALGTTKPPVIPDPGGKSNFIAAARRAAKAAVDAPAGDEPKAAEAEEEGKPKTGIGSRVRPFLVGTGVLLIVLGSLHLITNLLGSSDETPTDPAESAAPAETPAPVPAPAAGPAVAPPSSAPAATPAPTVPATPPSPVGRQSVLIPRGDGTYYAAPAVTAPATAPPIVAAPATIAPPEPTRQADAAAPPFGIAVPDIVTGSVRPAAAPLPPAPTPAAPAARPSEADKLPATIGSGGLRAAAVKGDASAEYEVAVRYAEGHGVPQNYGAAAEWFERAAKQGLVPAQFRLGGLYEKGMGVKKNVETARRLYSTAAEAGNAKAMHNLAVLYAEGIEGKPDYQTAARWFRRAAGFGVADSQYNLGVLYARGIGVEQNMAEAYKWFALAAHEGDKDAAKKRDDLGARLDPAALKSAMTAAQGFAPETQPEAAAQAKVPAGGWDGVPAPKAHKPRSVGPKID